MIVEVDGQHYDFPDDATDQEINAAIGPAKKPSGPITAGGAYQALDRGLANAAAQAGGAIGDISNLAVAGLDKATSFLSPKLGMGEYTPPDRSGSLLNKIPTSESMGKAIQTDLYGGAKPYEPQNKIEQYLKTGGEFAGNALLPGGVVRRAAQAVLPAVASETGGQLTEGTAAEPYARLFGALGGGIAAGVGSAASGARAAAKALPKITPDKLAATITPGYKAVDALGVEIAPSAVRGSINQTKADLAKRFDADLAPKTYGILSKEAETVAGPGQPAMGALTGVTRSGPKPVTSMDLDSLRRRLQEVTRGADPVDGAAATAALKRLDDAWEALPQASFVKGKAGEFTDLLKEVRGNYAASSRHEALDNLFENATRQAATAGSGANVQNSLRQAVKSFIKTDANSESAATRAGFNEAEIAKLDQFARKGGSNTARRAGNILGGGGGLGSMIASLGGHSLLGPAGVFTPGIGMAIKGAGNRAAQRQASGLLDMTLQRSPLALSLGMGSGPAPMGLPQQLGGGTGLGALFASPAYRGLVPQDVTGR